MKLCKLSQLWQTRGTKTFSYIMSNEQIFRIFFGKVCIMKLGAQKDLRLFQINLHMSEKIRN